jgi:hypothetical protein
MARKAWDDLSASYRQRLERGGITPGMHARGESIRSARGHERTPEHPVEGMNKPEKFRDWFDERRNLTDRVNDRKQQLFGTLNDRAKRITSEGAKGHYPSLSDLRKVLSMSDAEILDRLHAQDLDFSFLFYH